MAKKSVGVGFSLSSINTEQFALFDDNIIEKEKIALNAGLSFGCNQEEHGFLVTAKFTFEILEKPILTIQVSCYFEISDDSWKDFSNKEDGRIIFPKGFVAHMSMITVGTARGVLHAKTSGTKVNDLIIPTINVAKMVPEDVIFE